MFRCNGRYHLIFAGLESPWEVNPSQPETLHDRQLVSARLTSSLPSAREPRAFGRESVRSTGDRPGPTPLVVNGKQLPVELCVLIAALTKPPDRGYR